jgi:iron complex outermembrane receptor protein
MNGASNHLQPQTAKTYSFGFNIEPPVLPGLRTSLSFYHIDYEGTLGKPQVFNAPLLFAVYPQYVTQHPTLAQIQAFAAQAAVIGATALPYLGANPPLPVYQLVDYRTYNLGNTKLSGLDFSAGYTHATGFGSIDGRVSGNAQLTHETQISSGAPFVNDLLTNQSTLALSTTLGATIHNLRAQVTLNHTGGYDVVETSTLLQDHVGSFDVVNLFFLYTVNGKGLWRDLDFTLNVDNVLNRDPPVYKQPAGIGQSYGYANGATLGRLFQIGFSKKF